MGETVLDSVRDSLKYVLRLIATFHSSLES